MTDDVIPEAAQETGQEEVVVDAPSSLDMSDEEWLASGGSFAVADDAPATTETPEVVEGAAEGEADEVEAEAQPDAQAEAEGESADTESAETEQEEGEEKNPEDSVVDYKAMYEKLLAPFKANGKEMRVDNIDEALELMQKGAGFNKRMAALKPHLKTIKMLEKHGVLSDEKLSFLIDLENKNPEAIKKLLRESNIDPLALDLDQESDYKPEPKAVDEVELRLDEVVSSIRETPTFNQTLDLVGAQWDQASKETVAENPQLLKVINDHMANGVYDVISKALERARVFGSDDLDGLSDIQAYRKVGDAIQAQGGFDHLFAKEQAQEKPPADDVPTPAKKATDAKTVEKRKAASPVRPSASPAAAAPEFNPLALSDDDFLAQINSKFL